MEYTEESEEAKEPEEAEETKEFSEAEIESRYKAFVARIGG